MTPENPASKIIIVTGYSGAGLSSVLKTLEDLDFEALDNFPLPLIGPLLNDKSGSGKTPAIGVDSRTRGFCAETVLNTVKKLGATLVFIACDESVLQLRYSETRRKHPLAREKSVLAGIRQERALLADIRAQADLVIDTSDLTVPDLRHILEGHFRAADNSRNLTLSLMSFGFKHGLPREADIVMDVRFLQNPHWVPGLKKLTGLDEAVGQYVSNDPAYPGFMESFKSLIGPLLPRYEEEGKKYLTIAIGCTGGRHRSVHIVRELEKWLRQNGTDAHIEHRDIEL